MVHGLVAVVQLFTIVKGTFSKSLNNQNNEMSSKQETRANQTLGLIPVASTTSLHFADVRHTRPE